MVISKRRAWRTLTGSTQQANRRNTAMESDLSRRDFLRNAAKTTAGLSTLSGITFLAHPERVFGANDRVRVAVPRVYLPGQEHLLGCLLPSSLQVMARIVLVGV